MGDRLKQIWAEFEETTTRRLTGRGVENIAVPRRVDYSADDADFLPDEFAAPAQAAFSALRTKLEEQEKKFSPRNITGLGRRKAPQQEMDDDLSFMMTDDLIKGMKATALRTERPEADYETFLASDEGRASLKKFKKKKRFGIF